MKETIIGSREARAFFSRSRKADLWLPFRKR